jgi:hypothetical protein
MSRAVVLCLLAAICINADETKVSKLEVTVNVKAIVQVRLKTHPRAAIDHSLSTSAAYSEPVPVEVRDVSRDDSECKRCRSN